MCFKQKKGIADHGPATGDTVVDKTKFCIVQ